MRGVVAGVGRDGDDGFEAFVREHWSSLMSVAVAVTGSRADAEDVVQTALAATLGISSVTVRSQAHRGLAALRLSYPAREART